MKKTVVNSGCYWKLRSFLMRIFQTKFFPQILPEAVRSAAFMEYDQVSGEMRENPVHQPLLSLLAELRIFSEGTFELQNLLFEDLPMKYATEYIDVDVAKLVHLLSSADRWCNIIDLCKAIIVYLEGQPFLMPKLRPQSPLYAEGVLENEIATNEQVEQFLAEPPQDLPYIRSSQDLNWK